MSWRIIWRLLRRVMRLLERLRCLTSTLLYARRLQSRHRSAGQSQRHYNLSCHSESLETILRCDSTPSRCGKHTVWRHNNDGMVHFRCPMFQDLSRFKVWLHPMSIQECQHPHSSCSVQYDGKCRVSYQYLFKPQSYSSFYYRQVVPPRPAPTDMYRFTQGIPLCGDGGYLAQNSVTGIQIKPAVTSSSHFLKWPLNSHRNRIHLTQEDCYRACAYQATTP